MTPEQQPPEPDSDVERLVFECLEADDVDAAIDAMRTRRPDLADEVERVLSTLRDRGLLAEQPAEDPDQIPDRLGGFRLLRQLGVGGMGVVYLAEQEDLARKVALKLIRPEHLFFPGSRERFRREVEAVARLQHLGIAQIFTVGEQAGLPYFTMEYVEGPSLAQLLARLADRQPAEVGARQLAAALDVELPTAATPSGSSTAASRRVFEQSWTDTCVDLAIEIGEALQHAHERGVLHRDVKPSNVLITRSGQARLVDFGLARTEDAQQLTATTSQIGSLPYLPPEHLDGGPVIPSPHQDVYSLGVTLYEMLALRSAFQQPSAEATQKAIRDARPTPLRACNPSVTADLAIVCAAAMAPERDHRYATMADFVRDLDNVRRHRPISVSPPSIWVRLRRWQQRHPTGAAVSSVTVVLLAVAAVVFAVVENEARQHAEQLTAAAERRATEAGEVTEFLVDLFRYASPDHALGDELPVGLLLNQGRERIGNELRDQPDVSARLQGTLGRVYSWLGETEQAARLFAAAADLRLETHGAHDPERLRYLTQESEQQTRLGDYEAARDLLDEVARTLPQLGEPHRSPAIQRSLRARSRLLHTVGDAAGAERLLREMLGNAQTDPDGRLELAEANQAVAHFLAGEQRHQEALPLLREALALHEQVSPPGHPAVAYARQQLATSLSKLHQHDEAVPMIERALRDFERLFGPAHPRTAYALECAASVHRDAGDIAGALQRIERSAAIVGELRGVSRNFCARTRNDLAVIYQDLGRYEQARQQFEAAIAAARDAFVGDHVLTATMLVSLGSVESELGRHQDAREHAEQGLAMLQRAAPDARNLGACHCALAVVYSRLGTAEGTRLAGEHADLAIVAAGRYPDQTWQVARAHGLRAYLANLRGDGATAEQDALRALELYQEVDERDDPRVALTTYNVAWALMTQGKGLEAAEPFFRRSVAMYHRMQQDYPERAYPLNHYGYLLLKDRPAEALPLLQEAYDVRRRILPVTADWRMTTAVNLASAHIRLDHFEQAEPLLLEVHEALTGLTEAGSPPLRASAKRLVALYRRWGRDEQARRYEALLK